MAPSVECSESFTLRSGNNPGAARRGRARQGAARQGEARQAKYQANGDIIRFPLEARKRQVNKERMAKLADADNYQGVFTMNISIGK